MGPDSGKSLSNNSKLFIVFIFLLVVVVGSFFFVLNQKLKGDGDKLSVEIIKSSLQVKNHNPNDTKSGECLKNYFEDILLIIVYHFPFYKSIPLLKSFYKDTFKNILICGPEFYSDHHVMVVDNGQGYYGYECAGEAIRRYPGYRGYLYINDDMVVNWWTFYSLDKEKFWQGGRMDMNKNGHIMGNRPMPNNWPWWSMKTASAKACEDSYLEITNRTRSSYINVTKLTNIHLVNGGGNKRCFNAWSDLFYVPGKFSTQWQFLSSVFYKNRVFLEVAVPTLMSFLASHESWEKHYGMYLPDKYGSINFADGKLVWINYNYDLNFIHPVKFDGDVAKPNREKLQNEIIPYSKRFTKC